MKKIFIFLVISFVLVFTSANVNVYSAEDNESIDMYGLHVRNDSINLPSWYPKDISNFVGFHDSDIPRVVDMANILSAEEEEALREKISVYTADVNRDIVVVTDKSAYNLGHETYCYDFYDFNGYGIGRDFEGVCLFVCMDPNDRGWWVGATGYETREIYTESLATRLDDTLYEYMVNGDYAKGISNWVDNVYVAFRDYTPRDPATLPSWFPEDVDAFESFQDSERSRVVDFSDVLTNEQENELKKKIAEYSTKTGCDIVVVTDDSDYDLGLQRYGTCFFEFNGYGLGDGYEGMCLFLNTGKKSSNFWSGASGYNSSVLYDKFDDDFDYELRNVLQGENYYKAIYRWIEMVYALYAKGFPLAADWYPTLEEKDSFVRFHNTDAPRVIDSVNGNGIFTEEQKEVLSKKAKEISDKYGVDVVIHTATSPCGLSYVKYLGDFCYYNGYGLGDDYNTIIFCYFGDSKLCIETFGNIKDELSEVNYTRMYEQSDEESDCFKSAELFLGNLDHWERTGRVSRTAGQWAFAAVISSLVGLFFGRKSLKKAKKKMVTVKTAYGADNYISGSSDFKDGTDRFLNKNVSRTKIQRYTYSGSGSSRSSSSRSHSSYHSSSRGSSGRSHSGSGRRF